MDKAVAVAASTDESDVFFDAVDAVEGDQGGTREAAMEPKLKFERLSSDVRAVLEDDSATAICVHPKFIALGTECGRLHLLDVLGNPLPRPDRHSHSVQVSHISIDHTGEFVVSCSAVDGKVIVSGLDSRDGNHNMVLPLRANTVAIDPIFARVGSGRRLMTGDDRVVVLHEKTYFSRYKQQVISDPNDGPIRSLKWRGRFAAWAGRKGVVVYDVVEEKIISLIVFESNDQAEPKPAGCKVAWADQYTMYVARGDLVRVCAIKRRDPNEVRLMDLPEHYAEISHSFRMTKYWVCGVAPLDNLLVLLTVLKDRAKEKRPHLMVVQPLDQEHEEDNFSTVSTDLLSVKSYETCTAGDFHLEFLLEDKHYFIMAPKDVVVGKPRDQDDHLDWLLERGLFSQALDAVEGHEKSLRRHTFLKVGRQFLDHLILYGQFNEAAALCPRLFKTNQKLWQDEVAHFARLKQLPALTPFLPLGRSSGKDEAQLESRYYEMVLKSYLKLDAADQEQLLELVRRWPPDLYQVSSIVSALVEELLLDPDNQTLQRVLATLFGYQKKYDKAMAMYLKLGHHDVFQLIRKHSLFHAIQDKINDLMDLDCKESVQLFLDHTDRLPVDMIVGCLEGNDRHLYHYLDALFYKDREASQKYHGMLVTLYADFCPDKLMSFLRSSDHYPVQQALEACERRGLTAESIFILARMGSTCEALHLIINDLADIHKAVEFCKEHDDPELWNDLIDYSIDKPYFVNVLLHNIGTHVDPRILIQKIERGHAIPGLRDSLVQILHDYQLQVSLQEGCKKILVSDCYDLIERRVKCQSRGIAVSEDTICGSCLNAIVEPKRSKCADVVIFMCKHAFHAECISDEHDQCALCKGAFGAKSRLS